MAELQARLDLPPEEAVRYFAAKGEVIAWNHTDVWREANVHGWTVAKATTHEVLRTIRTEVGKAVGGGMTFAEFKRTLQPRLQDLGWWGRQEVLDGDTGEVTQVQLGSVRRLRTIYQTNVQTAYMAGRFKRYLANVSDRPYWRYVAVMDGRTRPLHVALNGKVWRWDDPIWQVIWPPNGWGCRCRVVAMTAAEFEASGLPLENGADAVVQLQVPIGRDGETVAVQGVRYRDVDGKERIFRPDPGWDYNPGAEWPTFDRAGPQPDAAPGAGAPRAATIASASDVATWRSAGRPDLQAPNMPRLPDAGLLPAAGDQVQARRMVRDALLTGGVDMRTVDTPVGQVVLRRELLDPVADHAGGALARLANLVVPTLESPAEVWLTRFADGAYRRRWLALFDGVEPMLMLVRENADGSLAWDGYGSSEWWWLNNLRRGTLLYGRDVEGGG